MLAEWQNILASRMDLAFSLLYSFSFAFQSGDVSNSSEVDKTERKLQESEDLMKRLTGIWEDKWSRTQKLIEVKC